MRLEPINPPLRDGQVVYCLTCGKGGATHFDREGPAYRAFYHLDCVRKSLDPFTRGYLDCALRLADENPGSGEYQFPEPFTLRNVAPEALAEAIDVCTRFQETIKGIEHPWDPIDRSKAGHDLYLTRNGHGAGFWDGDYFEPLGEALTEAAHALGESDLYQGDDGLFYFSH